MRDHMVVIHADARVVQERVEKQRACREFGRPLIKLRKCYLPFDFGTDTVVALVAALPAASVHVTVIV